MNAQKLNDLPLDGEIVEDGVRIKKISDKDYDGCSMCYFYRMCICTEIKCITQLCVYIEVKE